MKKVLLSLLIICSYPLLNAQPYLQWVRQAEEGASFQQIQQEAASHYKDRDQGRGSGYRQYKRWEYLAQDRLDENGALLNFSRMAWDAAQQYSFPEKKSDTENTGGCQSNWSILAPLDGYVTSPGGYNPGLGRVNVVAFHPSDPLTLYAGTPAGGLWKTVNQGGSWLPLTDHLPSIGVSGIAIHPQNPDLIYILTGDGDGADTYCIGVLKSQNGGLSWEETGLSFGVTQLTRGYKLVMQPGNPEVMLAATSAGLYRSANAGQTWSVVQTGDFVDIEFNPANPSIQYASTKNAVFRSVNAGASWSVISTNAGLPTGETRVALAVSPANPDYLYVFAGPADGDGIFKGLYRSVDGGLTYSTQAVSPNVLGYAISGGDDRHQSAYDLALAIDPDDAETVITGGINVWRSENGGETLDISAHWYYPDLAGNGLQYTHADIHELVYNPLDGSLWCGSDGGIFVSFDDGKTWEDRSSLGAPGLSITQFYRISGFAGNPNIIIGGTQDNGSNRWDGDAHIRHFDGADGMDCMLHPTDSTIQYHTRQNGSLRKSIDAGESHFNIRPGNTSGYWVTPLAMHPTDPETIYAAYLDTIYRSNTGGLSWDPFVPALDVGRYRSLHVAPANPEIIYAATDVRIFVTQNGGVSWAEITSGLPASTNSRMTMITTDADNPAEVWVTLSGYVNGNKVFYSSNAGGNWQNVSGSLPNLPVNCIVYDAQETGGDNALYIGMDVGVFYRDSSLNDWIPYFTGLPNVPVFDLEIHKTAGVLQAGTFGRGIWETPLYQLDEETPTINCPGPQLITFNADCVGVLPNLAGWAVVTDNCDPGPDVIQTPGPGALVNENTLVTLTVLDWEGNESSCQFEVIPVDNTAPVFVCPGDIQVFSCEETVVDYQISWGDNCSESQGSLIGGLSSGEVFPIGTTLVFWLASDAAGNTSSCSFSVMVTDSLDLNVEATLSCPNDGTGTATVEVLSGLSPYTYLWNDEMVQTGATATGLAPGTYMVEVTDSAGCKGAALLTVNESPEATVTVNEVMDETGSQANGAISVTVAGGLPPYQYKWRKDGEIYDNQEDLSGLSAGVYLLEITDANGCVFLSESIVVDNLSSVVEPHLRQWFRLYPNPAEGDLWVEWNGPELKMEVALLDLRGVELWRSALGDRQQIPVAGLAAGTYLVRITGEGWQVTEGVVVR